MSNNTAKAIPVFGAQESQTWKQRIAPYLAQWGAAAAAWPVGALSHWMWGTDPEALPWAIAGLSAGGVGLTALTARVSAGRPAVRAHTTITAAAGATWCTAATIVDPTTHPLIDMWLIGGAAVALSWNIRRLVGRAEKDGSKTESEFFKSVKLAGAKVRGEIEVHPNKAVAQLQLPPGQMTADDVTGAKGRIASALSVSANAVRVNPDPEHHDRATVTVVPVDMLKQPTPWPGPSAFGGSISAPLVVGIYEDGEPLRLWLPGDKTGDTPRNATHMIVMGMNGAGKSHGGLLAMTEILTRSDTILWVADPAKGLQTLGPIAPYVDWAELTPEGAQNMVDSLPDVIRARASELGRRGFDQWVPGCGLPYLVVWIEEAAPVVRDSESMIDIAQQARSAGISIVLSMQRPSYRNITTDVRQQMGAVWCYGVKSIDDAAFALSEDLIDAGANPAAWGNKKPGYSYLEAPGIDDDRMVQPTRTFATTTADLVAAIKAATPYRAACDPVTAQAAGDAYANRVAIKASEIPSIGGTAVSTPDQDGQQSATDQAPAAIEPAAPTAKPAKGAPDPFRTRLTADDDATGVALPVDEEDAELPTPDLDAELPAVDPGQVLAFGKTKPNLEQARRFLADTLAELRTTGATEVGPKDVGQAFFEHVRSRSWVSAEMARMAMAGALLETDKEGVYRFPATPDANAA